MIFQQKLKLFDQKTFYLSNPFLKDYETHVLYAVQK